MYDLIWIGNTLYPRWLVFGTIGLVFFAIILFSIIVSEHE